MENLTVPIRKNLSCNLTSQITMRWSWLRNELVTSKCIPVCIALSSVKIYVVTDDEAVILIVFCATGSK